jgi:hypothetical protein
MHHSSLNWFIDIGVGCKRLATFFISPYFLLVQLGQIIPVFRDLNTLKCTECSWPHDATYLNLGIFLVCVSDAYSSSVVNNLQFLD